MNETKYDVSLTQSQIENLIDFIELEFIESIKNDPEIDNFDYLIDMVNAYQELKRVKISYGLKGNDKNAYKEYCNDQSSGRILTPEDIINGTVILT